MFVVKQRGKIVGKGRTYMEAQNVAVNLTQPHIPTKNFSKAQLAQMVFTIEEE